MVRVAGVKVAGRRGAGKAKNAGKIAGTVRKALFGFGKQGGANVGKEIGDFAKGFIGLGKKKRQPSEWNLLVGDEIRKFREQGLPAEEAFKKGVASAKAKWRKIK